MLSKGVDVGSAGARQGMEQDHASAESTKDRALKELLQGKQEAAAIAQLQEKDRLSAGAMQRNLQSARTEMARNPGKYSYSANEHGISVNPEAADFGLTPGQKAADTAYGKDYAEYQAGGGYAGTQKSVENLEKVLGEVPDPNFLQRAAGILPKAVREVAMPGAVAAEDKAQEAVLASIKHTFPGAISNEEREAVLSKIYSPRQTKAENVRRITAELHRLKAAAQQKQSTAEMFERTGSVRGVGSAAASDPNRARLEELRRKAGK